MMIELLVALCVVAALVVGCATPALAQRREMQQMAADIRILQEQTQLLQNALVALDRGAQGRQRPHRRADRREPQGGRRRQAAGRCDGRRHPRRARARRRHQRADHLAVAGGRGPAPGDSADGYDDRCADRSGRRRRRARRSGRGRPRRTATGNAWWPPPAAPPASADADASRRSPRDRRCACTTRPGPTTPPATTTSPSRGSTPTCGRSRAASRPTTRSTTSGELLPARPAGRGGRGVQPRHLHLSEERCRGPGATTSVA